MDNPENPKPESQFEIPAGVQGPIDGFPELERTEPITEPSSQALPKPKTPEPETAELFQAEAVKKAKNEIEKTSGKGPTRYVSPRDTGPPPHIAKQVREDQGLSE